MELYHNWDFETVILNWNVLARGLVRTMQLAVVILAIGLTLGLFIGAARYSRRRILNWPAKCSGACANSATKE